MVGTMQINQLRALLLTGDEADRRLSRGTLSDTRLNAISRRRAKTDETVEASIRRVEARRLAIAIREAGHELKQTRSSSHETVAEKFPEVQNHFEEARTDILAFTAFQESGDRSGPTNPTEDSTARSAAAPTSWDLPRPWLRQWTHRRSPGRQHDDWIKGRRYLGLEVLARSRMALITTNDTTTEKEDLTPAALTAESAATGSRGGPFIHHDRGLDLVSYRAAARNTRLTPKAPWASGCQSDATLCVLNDADAARSGETMTSPRLGSWSRASRPAAEFPAWRASYSQLPRPRNGGSNSSPSPPPSRDEVSPDCCPHGRGSRGLGCKGVGRASHYPPSAAPAPRWRPRETDCARSAVATRRAVRRRSGGGGGPAGQPRCSALAYRSPFRSPRGFVGSAAYAIQTTTARLALGDGR